MPRVPASPKAGDILLRAGGLSAEQHASALARAQRYGGRIEDAIVELGLMSEADMLKALAAHHKTRFVTAEKLAKAEVTRAALASIPRRTAETLLVFPVLFDPATRSLSVVTADPDDAAMLREVQLGSGARELKAFLARPAAVRAAIAKGYAGDARAFTALEHALQAQFHAEREAFDSQLPPDDGAPMILLDERAVPSLDRAAADRERPPTVRDVRAPAPPAPPAPIAPPAPMAPPAPIAAPARPAKGDTVLELLNVMVGLLEHDRQELRGHSAHVARLVRRMGERLKLTAEQVHAAVIAAYLHDLGKHGRHHGKQASYHLTTLNCSEWEAHRHAGEKGVRTPRGLLEAVTLPAAALDAVDHMYERFDGGGFPDKLAAKEIPIGARILAVCDTYADLTENPRNPYRRMLSAANACAVLAQHRETIFDPKLTDMMSAIMVGEGVRAKIASRYSALIVDADPGDTTVLELRLAEQGFEVRTAASAAEALKVLAGGEIDLVIGDVELPGKDGLALLAEVRRAPWGKDLPWVVHTRRQAKVEAEKAFALGVLDFVAKGGSTDVLVAKLKALLDQRASIRGSRGLSGSLAEMALPELVQVLSQSRKTGNLKIRRAGEAGEIHFQEGDVVNATWGALRGEEAFYAILALKEGDFGMDPGYKPAVRVIHANAESLLLEAMRRLDEARVT
jgi:response regulator RpfG family c-di-GMP phosphodiesterase